MSLFGGLPGIYGISYQHSRCGMGCVECQQERLMGQMRARMLNQLEGPGLSVLQLVARPLQCGVEDSDSPDKPYVAHRYLRLFDGLPGRALALTLRDFQPKRR